MIDNAQDVAFSVVGKLTSGVEVSDPDAGQQLTVSWELTEGDPATAPTLDNPDLVQPTFTPGECGEFFFKVTVKDTCGGEASKKIKITVNADGPHVSNTLCPDEPKRCGTVKNPWCEPGEAFSKGALDLKLHGSGKDYGGDITIPDGGVLTGGYDNSFGATPNLTAESNGTVLATKKAAGLEVDAKSKVKLVGIRVRQTADTQTSQSSMTADATASVEIVGSILEADPSLKLSKESFGLQIIGPGQAIAGSFLISSSQIRGPLSPVSYGIFSVSGAFCDVTISNSTILGGDTSIQDQPSFSVGASLSGKGSLRVVDSLVSGGAAGVINETTEGVSVGVAAFGLSLLEIKGDKTIIKGKGNFGGNSLGLQAIGVGSVNIQGGSFFGSDEGNANLNGSAGVQLVAGDSSSNGAVPFSITNAKIFGGKQGLFRAGLQIYSLSGSIQGCEIAGSEVAGGISAIGVSVSSLVRDDSTLVPFSNGKLEIKGNNIAGGAPASVTLNTAFNPIVGYRAHGVEIDGSVPEKQQVDILDNESIKGCASPCVGAGDNDGKEKRPAVATGVAVAAGKLTIASNKLIAAGGHVGPNGKTLHAGVYAVNGLCFPEEPELCINKKKGPTLSLGNNSAIVGAAEFVGNSPVPPADTRNAPRYSYGLLSVRPALSIDGGLFFGGWAASEFLALSTSTGSYINEAQGGSKVERAQFAAGSSRPNASGGIGYGAVINMSPGIVVNANTFDGCVSTADTSANPCESNATRGLVVGLNDDALITNNYAFSGFAGDSNACAIYRSSTSSVDKVDRFFHNLCLAQGSFFSESTALQLNATDKSPNGRGFRAESNILAVLSGNARYYIKDGAQTPHEGVTLKNNLFVDLTTLDKPLTVKPTTDSSSAYYLRRFGAGFLEVEELDSMGKLNSTLGVPVLSENVVATSSSLFVTAAPVRYFGASASDFHLDPSKGACSPASRGGAIPGVGADFDGDARPFNEAPKDVSTEIGPDEIACPAPVE